MFLYAQYVQLGIFGIVEIACKKCHGHYMIDHNSGRIFDSYPAQIENIIRCTSLLFKATLFITVSFCGGLNKCIIKHVNDAKLKQCTVLANLLAHYMNVYAYNKHAFRSGGRWLCNWALCLCVALVRNRLLTNGLGENYAKSVTLLRKCYTQHFVIALKFANNLFYSLENV